MACLLPFVYVDRKQDWHPCGLGFLLLSQQIYEQMNGHVACYKNTRRVFSGRGTRHGMKLNELSNQA